MGDGKGRPQAGSCPTQGGLMPVKDGAQPAFIFTAVPQRGGTVGAGGRGGRSPFRRSRKPRAERVEPAGGGRAAPRASSWQKPAEMRY